MRRLLHTTGGTSVVKLGLDPFLGKTVSVDLFDEEGWETRVTTWSTRYGHHERYETLAEFLATTLGIPSSEAEPIAASIAGPWWDAFERSGELAADRKLNRAVTLILAVVAFVLVLATVGAVLLTLKLLR